MLACFVVVSCRYENHDLLHQRMCDHVSFPPEQRFKLGVPRDTSNTATTCQKCPRDWLVVCSMAYKHTVLDLTSTCLYITSSKSSCNDRICFRRKDYVDRLVAFEKSQRLPRLHLYIVYSPAYVSSMTSSSTASPLSLYVSLIGPSTDPEAFRLLPLEGDDGCPVQSPQSTCAPSFGIGGVVLLEDDACSAVAEVDVARWSASAASRLLLTFW